ncbi:hypothetical protein ACFUZA_00205 [Streptomyces cellulosae]|uniref:hypothetical protein n=1 Tax=Streptomyces cellulosae TaxID=1968 RepID=UPI0036A33EE0
MADTSALNSLYEALQPADREAVDARRGLGASLQAALTGAGLLLPLPTDPTAAQCRQAVAEQLGVRLVALDLEERTTVDPPSRDACAVVAAAAGEWAQLTGGHITPGDWRALIAATSADPHRLHTARRRALDLILARHAAITAAAHWSVQQGAGRP